MLKPISSNGSSRAEPLATARASLTRSALLAQLVEHFHGKEGVVGSSPTEGLGDCLCLRGFRAMGLPARL